MSHDERTCSASLPQGGPSLAAVAATRQGQAEVSADLGRRVRTAVERLIHAYSSPLAGLNDRVTPRHIYHAATRVMMRLLACLFAEARDMLPRDNPIYHDSYGIHGLLETVIRERTLSAGERCRRTGAWPRVLALFRLVYEGSPHVRLLLPAYGGALFAPGDASSPDPLSRALAVFEQVEHAPSDEIVHGLLILLGRARVKVRQNHSNIWVEGPVDYAQLSSEHIGILYEGLLDFELCRAPADEPIVVLASGGAHAIGLSRLASAPEPELRTLAGQVASRTPGQPFTDARVLRIIEPGELFLARNA